MESAGAEPAWWRRRAPRPRFRWGRLSREGSCQCLASGRARESDQDDPVGGPPGMVTNRPCGSVLAIPEARYSTTRHRRWTAAVRSDHWRTTHQSSAGSGL